MAFKIPFPTQPHKIDYPGLGDKETDKKLKSLFSAIDQEFAELYTDIRLLTAALNASPVLSGTTKSTSVLAGPPGQDGSDGEDGMPGVPGKIGITGPQGVIGPPGEDGADGDIGPIGPVGLTGAQGLTGNQGLPGLAVAAALDDYSTEDQIWTPPGILYPSQITVTTTGNITDLSVGMNSIVLMNNTTLATIKGIVAGFPGQLITFISIGAGQVDFTHQDAGESIAANRLINIATSLNTSLYPGKGIASYQYDSVTARWRLISHFQGGLIFYTTTWTGSVTNPVLGNGTLSASYFLRGSNIWNLIILTAGSTTTFGSGFWQFSTPVGVSPIAGTPGLGTGLAIDVVNNPNYSVTAVYSGFGSGGTLGVVDATNLNIDATHPFTWQNTDILRLMIEFAVA